MARCKCDDCLMAGARAQLMLSLLDGLDEVTKGRAIAALIGDFVVDASNPNNMHQSVFGASTTWANGKMEERYEAADPRLHGAMEGRA